jgi:hypothetical protein
MTEQRNQGTGTGFIPARMPELAGAVREYRFVAVREDMREAFAPYLEGLTKLRPDNENYGDLYAIAFNIGEDSRALAMVEQFKQTLRTTNSHAGRPIKYLEQTIRL